MLAQQLAEPADHLTATCGRHGAPAAKGVLGPPDRLIDTASCGDRAEFDAEDRGSHRRSAPGREQLAAERPGSGSGGSEQIGRRRQVHGGNLSWGAMGTAEPLPTVFGLAAAAVDAEVLDHLDVLHLADELDGQWDPVPRRVLAQALNACLFAGLVDRVPSAAAYVAQRRRAEAEVVLDHGAVRTVAWPGTGALPPGTEQVSRILEPLGYSRRETYPLRRLRMTGYAYTHLDLPQQVGQWFVSELHPDEFSEPFRAATARVLGTSRDPLDAASSALLEQVAATGELQFDDAVALLVVLVGCFDRLHLPPLVGDYELLLAESAEMAWIATEGTAFNHATDRVVGLEQVAARERRSGRPMKPTIEVSGSGRVRQTAHRATSVRRAMRTAEGGVVVRDVPGSFFEFIERESLPDRSGLDLGFDAANAQGIFAMTRAADDSPGGHGRAVSRAIEPSRSTPAPSQRPS